VTEYLEIGDALQVVDRYGFHIRDIGLLAAALARPATTVMGVEAYPQLAMKAAADVSIDAAFDLVVGVAAGDVSLEVSAGMIGKHLIRR
jgi:death-on-curing protein